MSKMAKTSMFPPPLKKGKSLVLHGTTIANQTWRTFLGNIFQQEMEKIIRLEGIQKHS